MPMTKEEEKEYKRLYYLKNKEKIQKNNRLNYINNKETIKEQVRLYYINNKEKKKKTDKEWMKTEQGKKSNRIGQWKYYGILCFDWNLLYDLFLSTTNCEFCNCELNTNTKTRKCLDHDHSINDKFNVRGVLCNCCNLKDVLK